MKFCMKIDTKSDVEGIVVMHYRHILFEVSPSKYQWQMLQLSGMFEVFGYMLQLHFSFLNSDRSENML